MCQCHVVISFFFPSWKLPARLPHLHPAGFIIKIWILLFSFLLPCFHCFYYIGPLGYMVKGNHPDISPVYRGEVLWKERKNKNKAQQKKSSSRRRRKRTIMNLLKLIRAAVKIPTPHQVRGSTQVRDPPMKMVAGSPLLSRSYSTCITASPSIFFFLRMNGFSTTSRFSW